ncbi:hypothetical protein ACMA1D_10565 [Streptomyces sp. 796.1]|uniref:hypothetical protein n=1 Tax=Streptomyces sp. 796.1 TaxID=3163029 RepID=UPI0039C9CFC7
MDTPLRRRIRATVSRYPKLSHDEAERLTDEIAQAVTARSPVQAYSAELTRIVATLVAGFQAIARRQMYGVIGLVAFVIVWSLWVRPVAERWIT